MKRFSFKKLARDKAIELFTKYNITTDYKILNKEEFIVALKDKFIEELNEVMEAIHSVHKQNNKEELKEELIEELADLQEVLDSMSALLEVSSLAIKEKQNSKHAAKGGFAHGIYIHHIDVPQTSEYYEYFSGKPKQYPELICTDK